MLQFLNVLTQDNKITNILLLRRPSSRKQVEQMSRKYQLFGITSKGMFPKNDPKTIESTLGWLHCFREADKIFPENVKKTLISRSDFCNSNVFVNLNLKKKYGFVYSMIGNNQRKTKNFSLFCECLYTLTYKMKLRGVIIGSRPDIPKPYDKYIETFGKVDTKTVVSILNKSMIAFFPNEKDASPRFITEALCTNTPVVVNRRIYGGWKYVNYNSGSFFDGPDNVEEAFLSVLSSKTKSREWFCDNFGIEKTGKKLFAFVQAIAKNPTEAQYYKI